MFQKIFFGVLALALIFAGVVFMRYQKFQDRGRKQQVMVLASSLASSIEASKAELGKYPSSFCEMGFVPQKLENLEIAYQPLEDRFKLTVTNISSGFTLVLDESGEAKEGMPLGEAGGVERLKPGDQIYCD